MVDVTLGGIEYDAELEELVIEVRELKVILGDNLPNEIEDVTLTLALDALSITSLVDARTAVAVRTGEPQGGALVVFDFGCFFLGTRSTCNANPNCGWLDGAFGLGGETAGYCLPLFMGGS